MYKAIPHMSDAGTFTLPIVHMLYMLGATIDIATSTMKTIDTTFKPFLPHDFIHE